MGQRCYQCFRPISHCFCAAIPRIDNQTPVLILQHVGERFHRFNTARIVNKALRQCELMVGHNRQLAEIDLPIQNGARLLYPAADAPFLDELPDDARPAQLVIIDGTWNQAKTVYRDVRQLQQLACFRLRPQQPGRFRIRKEPDDQSLSTIEATVAALQALEPGTEGIESFAKVFETMVDDQLDLMASSTTTRNRKPKRWRPRHLPSALLGDASRLVIAYGESPPRSADARIATAGPVNWHATRLSTGETFRSRLWQATPLPPAALDHMRLLATNDQAETADEFRRRWSNFLRPNDVLVVYHLRTYHLLGQIAAAEPRCICLKSVFRKWRNDFQSVEELAAVEGLPESGSRLECRASERLGTTIALVKQLRAKYGERSAEASLPTHYS